MIDQQLTDTRRKSESENALPGESVELKSGREGVAPPRTPPGADEIRSRVDVDTPAGVPEPVDRLGFFFENPDSLMRFIPAEWTTPQKRKAAIVASRGGRCLDCGGKFPLQCYQFDHRPGERKLYNISRLLNARKGDRRLATELKKCDMVCANCHAIRTAERGGARRHVPCSTLTDAELEAMLGTADLG